MRLYTKEELQIIKAASNDETSPSLNGVLVDGNKLVATDGHRLMIVENTNKKDEPWPIEETNWKQIKEPFIVPKKAIEKAIKNIPKKSDIGPMVKFSMKNELLKKVAIGQIEENKINLQTSDLKTTDNVQTRMVENKFPNYKQVVPSNDEGYDKTIGLNATYMIEALQMMLPFTSNNKMVKFSMKDENHSIVLECDNNGIKTTCIVMPIRL
jgi:DNA polymerase III sliding clamp (beta) subunit (PCNA family)